MSVHGRINWGADNDNLSVQRRFIWLCREGTFGSAGKEQLAVQGKISCDAGLVHLGCREASFDDAGKDRLAVQGWMIWWCREI
jgi:hypothetical protein